MNALLWIACRLILLRSAWPWTGWMPPGRRHAMGYHIDSARDMTAWRDWVIRAFNDNKPFDRFTVEQLAGDLTWWRNGIPPPAPRGRPISVASGFNRNHMINYEGGAIPDESITPRTF